MATREISATTDRILSAEALQDIFDALRKFTIANEFELLVSGGHSSLTRFANNTIHQNVAESDLHLSVRVVFGGRTARATTNKLDETSLRRVVEAAESLARVQQPDPELLPMCSVAESGTADRAPTRHFDSTAAVSPAERAEAVEKIVDIAKRHTLTAAGIYSISDRLDAVLNSRGVTRFHRQTIAEISVTMLGNDSAGWQKANSPRVEDLDPVQLAETAAQKARDSAHPRELAPGKYAVILEPAAVLDLVGFMFLDFGGLSVLDRRSFLNDRIGTRLFGENITIEDDVYHPAQAGPAFDGEGVARQRVRLVENGVIKNLVYARATAEKMRRSEFAANVGRITSTGHGFPLPNEIGEAPLNIVLAAPPRGSEKNVNEMVASTERGVLVTRLWYIREVDPYEKILTGMTRDGTFCIENGKVQYGIRNFRFNQGLIDMLSSVEEMGSPVRASGEESFDMVVPPMKVRDFNFTEVTRF